MATPVFLPGESHGQRSLVGCSPRGRKESDTTERLTHTHIPHTHTHTHTHRVMTEDSHGLYEDRISGSEKRWVL